MDEKEQKPGGKEQETTADPAAPPSSGITGRIAAVESELGELRTHVAELARTLEESRVQLADARAAIDRIKAAPPARLSAMAAAVSAREPADDDRAAAGSGDRRALLRYLRARRER